MYVWLEEALDDDASILVTANRRLARELNSMFAERRLQEGATAWRRPAIYSWHEWLAVLVESCRPDRSMPVRINNQQSRVVWEHCLRADIDDPLINIGSLARLCRDTWNQLHAWRVPLTECQARAAGQDQRIFARAAGRYETELQSRGWIDDAMLPDTLSEKFRQGTLQAPRKLTIAGFDRLSPQAATLIDSAVEAGAGKQHRAAMRRATGKLVSCETPDSELRAAGQWARKVLTTSPSARLAIIVNDLEKDADRSARLLREGFLPGWQYAQEQYGAALNVSFGRRLSDYPAIHDALLMLRFLARDLRAADISLLLRSPFFGDGSDFGRSRLELQLREVPDRQWSKSALLRFLRRRADKDNQTDGADWLDRIATVTERLQQVATRQSAARWAECVDQVLEVLRWPGTAALSSADFQLINRWRDLLNELARLDLVSGAITYDEAVARLDALAGDTIFQAETSTPVVSVLGVLEAAGMEFDRLWVTGLTAASWPPPGKPLVLVSRELQQLYAMPDAVPADTTAFAERVLRRLAASADEVVFSFPRLIGDAEQMPSALLTEFAIDASPPDSGWHAATLTAAPLVSVADRVPAMRRGETVTGGAATIKNQCHDPFAAFAFGRLGIRWLPLFEGGIPARIRGSLIHDALQRLYADLPDREAIRGWSKSQISQRIARAIEQPFRQHARYADSVLKQLLAIESERCATLLESVIAVDRGRNAFRIDSVESDVSVTLSGATFNLRCDRVDRHDDGGLIVIDYKTGAKRRFLTSGEPGDLQLVLYACALDASVAGLALFNVDSRETGLDGAGPAFNTADDWQRRLDEWKDIVRAAAAMIAAGDARLNVQQNSRDARPLDVLSRYAELRRES